MDLSQHCQILDHREVVGNLVDGRSSLDGGLVARDRVDRLDAKLPHFVPPAVPTIPCDLYTLVFIGCKEHVGKRQSWYQGSSSNERARCT